MSSKNEVKRQKTIEQVQLAQMKEALVWKKTFGTEDGKKCLDLLKEMYYDVDMIASNDPIVTQNKAAQRDLVRYIITQVEQEIT